VASVTADVGEAADAGPGGYIPASLHQGELGIAVLAADLTRPGIASMPSFGRMRRGIFLLRPYFPACRELPS